MKKVLSLTEVRRLCMVMREVLTYLYELRERELLAGYIKFPQIPPELSESLVYYLLKDRRLIPSLADYEFQLGGGADLVARHGTIWKKIEVKATADKGWQRLRKLDVAADYLIWLHFGNYFIDTKADMVEVYVIPHPGRYYEVNKDAFVRDIRDQVGTALSIARITLTQIAA